MELPELRDRADLVSLADQQPALPSQPARKPSQPVIGSKDTMARHEHGDWIRTAGAAHGANSFRILDRHRYLRVTPGPAPGNLAQGLPYAPLKIGAAG